VISPMKKRCHKQRVAGPMCAFHLPGLRRIKRAPSVKPRLFPSCSLLEDHVLKTKQVIADAYQKLIPMLIENHMPKALFLSTPSYNAPGDVATWKWSLLCGMVKLVFRTGWEEMVKIGQVVTATPKEQLPWTLFRVGVLKDEPSDEFVVSHPGSGQDGLSINRAGIIAFVLQESVENRYVGRTPYISSK